MYYQISIMGNLTKTKGCLRKLSSDSTIFSSSLEVIFYAYITMNYSVAIIGKDLSLSLNYYFCIYK